MLKTDSQKEQDEQLMVLVADRIIQALEAAPARFRAGRGRPEDFAAKFGTSRSTAVRILSGDALPSPRLICQIARELNLTADWLLGLSDEPLEAHAEQRPVRIEVWPQSERDPTPPLVVPRSLLPRSLATAGVVAVPWPDHGCQPFIAAGDMMLVEPRTKPTHGGLHVLAWQHGRLDAARLSMFGASEQLMLQIAGGRTETVALGDVAFGLPPRAPVRTLDDGDAAEIPTEPAAPLEPQPGPLLRVIGVIVGRVGFHPDGLYSIESGR